MKHLVTPRPVRVLLVEDSLPIRQRVRSLIEESGAATIVGEAGTVATALARFRELQPDAVVLDLHLAEGSGYSVLKAIKQAQPGCTVIVLTNFSTPENREHCYFLGVDHFFEKYKEFERVPEVLAGVGRGGPRGGRILIADDEVLVGSALKQVLAAVGYDCTWVPDAADALQALRQSRFDLLIADINMPGNRQLELLAELGTAAPGLPVILLTGDPSVGTAAAAVRLHANAYLVKPPDLTELKFLVQEAIANSRVHQAVQRQWAQFQALFHDLTHQLAAARNGEAEPGEVQELEGLFRALGEVVRAGGGPPAPDVTASAQHLELVGAVCETIAVLEKTKRFFKSKTLGTLRTRLETLVGSIEWETAAAARGAGSAAEPVRAEGAYGT